MSTVSMQDKLLNELLEELLDDELLDDELLDDELLLLSSFCSKANCARKM